MFRITEFTDPGCPWVYSAEPTPWKSCSSGATRQVAVVCGISHDEAREELGRLADERHMGYDGFWALNGSG